MSKSAKRIPKVIEDEHEGGRKIRNHLRRMVEDSTEEILDIDDEDALEQHRAEMEFMLRTIDRKSVV